MPVTIESEFLRHVHKTEGCWVWRGKGNRKNGYGLFGQTSAHRFAYMLYVGPIPDKYDIHHKCHVRSCVNPAHLEALPHHKHIEGPPAVNAAKTHCKHGHEFSEENTYYRVRDGRRGRQCKTCRSRSCLAAYYKRRSACR